jgi:hypothetical protein
MTARALVAAAFTLLALPAAAQDCGQPILMIREDGLPVYTMPSKEIYDATREQVRHVMGDPPGDRTILVINIRTNQAAWVARSQLSAALNAFDASLHDSLVYEGPDHCRPKDIPWTFFDPAEPGREPIVLFPDEAILPRSGLWRAEIGPTQMTGCPAMMRDAFPVSAGALPGMTGGTRRMTFADPFHPDTLDMSRTAGVRWAAAGANRWTSTDLAADAFAQIPQGEGGGSRIVWTFTVVSPERITFERSIELILPAVATATLGVSSNGCRVTGTDRWVRVGD